MDLKKILLLMTLLAVFASFGFSQAAAVPTYNRDFQLWNDTQIIIPLDKKKEWSFVIWAFGRFGDNARTTTDARIGGLITKKINKNISVAGGYLYRYSNATFVRRRYESRYIGSVTFTVPLGKKFTFVNRNQIQYEDRYLRLNAFVFRPRVTLKREVTVGKTKIEPFVSFEPFIDSVLGGAARYREQIGIGHKFNKALSANFFYVRQDETGNGRRPGTLNGFGTSLKVTVR